MNLITGGTGFLGAHLAALLLKQQQNVRILKRPTSSLEEFMLIFDYHFGSSKETMIKKIHFQDGDLLNPFDIEDALQNVSSVYHCAAFVSFRRKDKREMNRVNVLGTKTLVNVILDHQNIGLCHVSSIAALGRSNNHEMINENTLWENNGHNSAYSVSKYLGELEVWRGIAEGLKAFIVQPGVLLGPGLLSKGTSKLFALVKSGLKYYTKGVNGYIDVEDTASRMIFLMNKKISGDRFVLVSENLSYIDLFRYIASALNVQPPSVHAGYQLRKLVVFVDLIKSLLSLSPRTFSSDFARLAGQKSMYDSAKILQLFPEKFTHIAETIHQTGRYYKQSGLL